LDSLKILICHRPPLLLPSIPTVKRLTNLRCSERNEPTAQSVILLDFNVLLEHLQSIVTSVSSSAAKDVSWESWALTRKKEGTVQNFTLFEEKDLQRQMKNGKVLSFDMTKLEAEYDYETDECHILNSQSVLTRDLYDAVEFFVVENPILFVENFERKI
jgi:hypothetical protein